MRHSIWRVVATETADVPSANEAARARAAVRSSSEADMSAERKGEGGRRRRRRARRGAGAGQWRVTLGPRRCVRGQRRRRDDGTDSELSNNTGIMTIKQNAAGPLILSASAEQTKKMM